MRGQLLTYQSENLTRLYKFRRHQAIKGIYGINVAVRNLEEAVRKYEAFFGVKAQSFGSEFFAFPGLVGAQFNINGFHLNLIASLEDGTSVAQFLERRGEGVFLLSVEPHLLPNPERLPRDPARPGVRHDDYRYRTGRAFLATEPDRLTLDLKLWILPDVPIAHVEQVLKRIGAQ